MIKTYIFNVVNITGIRGVISIQASTKKEAIARLHEQYKPSCHIERLMILEEYKEIHEVPHNRVYGIHTLIEQSETKARNDGFVNGYRVALNDFYRALKSTHMTPDEIIKKLSLD